MPAKAMVFAAGLGTRMRPVTDTMPKPLIKVGDRPMIDHMLDRFADVGVAEAIVNVHYMADQIEAHLLGRTKPHIVFSDERSALLDQAGGIRKALPLLGAELLLCNTDAFWLEGPRSNIEALAARWDPEAMDILLLVAASTSSVGVDWPGDFLMLSDGRLQRRAEREVARSSTQSGYRQTKPVSQRAGRRAPPRALLFRGRRKRAPLWAKTGRPMAARRHARGHRRSRAHDRSSVY